MLAQSLGCNAWRRAATSQTTTYIILGTIAELIQSNGERWSAAFVPTARNENKKAKGTNL